MNTFDGCCGSCIHMNTNDYVGHKDHCYCTYRRQYYNLTERKCSYYQYDRNKDYYDLNRRWHVVSAVSCILPETMYMPGFSLLADFRTAVLEKDSRFDRVLGMYDILGPFLAGKLYADPRRMEICRSLALRYFPELIRLIREGKNEQAFRRYASAVRDLAERYREDLDRYLAIKQVRNLPEDWSRLAA